MRAGDLDQWITIETPSAASDELGQDGLTWLFLEGRAAKVIEEQGREFLKGGYRAEEKAVFVVRWGEFDSTMRVLWGGRTWRVTSVTGTMREGWIWLHCIASEGPN